MGNAFGWVPAQYPTPDAAGSVAEYRLAEASHALQQLPLDGLLLPLRLTQAQVYISYSALQTLCVPSRRGALLKTLIDTPDTILPACCKLYTALRHEAVLPTDLALTTSKDGSHDVILGHLTELQQAATSTIAQLEDLKGFLQQHPAVHVTAAHEQVCGLLRLRTGAYSFPEHSVHCACNNVHLTPPAQGIQTTRHSDHKHESLMSVSGSKFHHSCQLSQRNHNCDCHRVLMSACL